MKKPNWIPLFTSSFLTVFSDNLLKWLVCFISIKWVAGIDPKTVIAIASGMLVFPFIFLSPLAGLLAVKYQKRTVFLWGKIAEIPIMLIAVTGFITQNLYIAMTAVLLLGFQSALFSPSKYGLIRDVGGEEGIPFGTGTMEMLTFFGVLMGTFIASVVSQSPQLYIIIILLLGGSLISLLSTYMIKVTEPEPEISNAISINPIVFIIDAYKKARTIKGLNYVIIGLSFFWLVGALLQMNIKEYCPQVLKLGDVETGIMMVIAAIGIGAGCFFTGIMLKNRVNMTLVPIGGALMVLFLALTYFLNPDKYLFGVLMFLTAFSCGIFKIPLNYWIQSNVKGRMLGDILAYENISEFAFILFSSVIFAFFELRTIFMVLSIITLFITIVLFYKIPGLRSKKSKSL